MGTSGWHYPHWRRRFYPSDLPEPQWLAHYARHFDAVEVASSLHRLPGADMVEAWCSATPPGFQFSFVAPRRITHDKKLKGCDRELGELGPLLRRFGSRLGAVVFQLPERWRCNLRRLDRFLSALEPGRPYVFELRDPTWHVPEVSELLRRHDAGCAVFDCPNWGNSKNWGPDLEATADIVYVRLRGPAPNSTGNYRAQTLRTWAGRASRWNREGRDVFVIFDNDELAFAAKNARRFLAFAPGDKTAQPA